MQFDKEKEDKKQFIIVTACHWMLEPIKDTCEFCRTIYRSMIKHLLVSLKMIFLKNNRKTMIQLWFKFTSLPAESARVCLFCERLMQSFIHTKKW
jgi:hypothetical protein